MNADCDRVGQWLISLRDRALDGHISAAAADHLETCADCRRQIQDLLREAVGVAVQPISCDDALDQLPALIDIEHRDGTYAAARLLADVWWHRLTCRDCLMHARLLLAASRMPPIRPMTGAPLLSDETSPE